jgi:hypothetical protein
MLCVTGLASEVSFATRTPLPGRFGAGHWRMMA